MPSTLTPVKIIVTKMRRADHGQLEARVSINGNTWPVTRRFGSWTTIPISGGGWQDVLPPIAKVLQERARAFERHEQEAT